MSDPRAAKLGAVFAILAFGAWGIVPLYWRAVSELDPIVVLAQRVVWSAVFVLAILLATRRLGEGVTALRSRASLRYLVPSAFLIAINWGIFIWAVLAHELASVSLGYFMNPLANVLIGVLLLGERLRPLARAAVVLAGAAVVVLAFSGGSLVLPLSLTATFAIYGYLRKQAPVDSLIGLFVETVITVPFALAFLVVRGASMEFLSHPLILLAGPITALPLLAFSAAARRLPLSRLGFFQYLAPSLQLFLAFVVLGEPVALVRWAAFGLVWFGLVLVTFDAARARSESRTRGTPVEHARSEH